MKKEINTYGINTIICPYCGFERESTWDDTENGIEFENQEEQCNKCGEYFLMDCSPYINCVFTTEKWKEV